MDKWLMLEQLELVNLNSWSISWGINQALNHNF